jgi:hypothetical protein
LVDLDAVVDWTGRIYREHGAAHQVDVWYNGIR